MTPEERSILAGELALGVLEGPERAEALRLTLSDPDFAREVERWKDHFATLFAAWPEVEPDPSLEGSIMAAVAGSGSGPSAPVVVGRPAGFWRAVAMIATLAAACLLAVLALRPGREAPPVPAPAAERAAPLIAVLKPTEGDPFAAVVERDTGAIRLTAAPDVPAGRVAELWTIAEDGAPRSLGVLAGRRLVAAPDARARLRPGVALAISVEPPGGSPTGSPTGPVIASGPLAAG